MLYIILCIFTSLRLSTCDTYLYIYTYLEADEIDPPGDAVARVKGGK
jgi:hypothetical protein